MASKTLINFFSDKTLVIPGYQRDYAWATKNVDDLLNDVEEALADRSGHYLGTFILSQEGPEAPAFVVDGQQRLTTLTLIFHALVRRLEKDELRFHYRSQFIKSPATGLKLNVHGGNQAFLQALVDGTTPVPGTDGQERLSKAYDRISLRVDELLAGEGGQARLEAWLLQLSRVEVLEFVAEDEGRAIRMFQSVNDRGVPLSKMDIVKSLLIYSSNRYLNGALDESIAEAFGRAFHAFSRLKRLVSVAGYQVNSLSRDTFREDDVLRYHFLTFNADQFGVNGAADYAATTQTVLEDFLKPALKQLRADPAKLRHFLETYTNDLVNFFGLLEAELQATRTDFDVYLMWVAQNVSATLHPLILRLRERGLLDQPGEQELDGTARTLRQLIEVADIRALKLNSTNPQAGIFKLVNQIDTLTTLEIGARLKHFSQRFLADDAMRDTLTKSGMYKNPSLVRILIEEERHHLRAADRPDLDIAKLVALAAAGISQEHIVSQAADESFSLEAYGFGDAEEFSDFKDRLGNLTLLETSINSACSNRTVEVKVSLANLYQASDYLSARKLAATLSQSGKRFTKDGIEARSAELASRAVQRWPL
jgi:hypothetical protein